MRPSLCAEGCDGGDSPWTILSLQILRTVEQTIKLITIVLSIYELVMAFFHGQIRVAYSYIIGW